MAGIREAVLEAGEPVVGDRFSVLSHALPVKARQ